jgi:hypothetical protein
MAATISLSSLTHTLAQGSAWALQPSISGANAGEHALANPTLAFWRAFGLPSGLSINPATGMISGVPAAAGAYSVSLQFFNYFCFAGGSTGIFGAENQHGVEYANPTTDGHLGEDVVIYRATSTALPTAITEGRTYQCADATEARKDRMQLFYSGVVIDDFTPSQAQTLWAQPWLLTSPSNASNALTLTLTVEGIGLEDEEPSFPVFWNTQTGDITAPAFPVTLPSDDELAGLGLSMLSPGLRDGLVLPVKLSDASAWYVSFRNGTAADSTVPETLALVVWDEDGQAITVGTASDPVAVTVDDYTYYPLEVTWDPDALGYLVSRSGDETDVILDAELRLTTYAGRRLASRTFLVWLEDSER